VPAETLPEAEAEAEAETEVEVDEPEGAEEIVAAAGEPAAENGDRQENGERKRRRRGRRGRRGRGKGATAPVPENGAVVPVPRVEAVEAEPFVPRGVSSEELMPAATGGRRRRRGGRGRFPRRGGPEPASDSQLISPSNPIPDRGFDD